MRKAIVVVALVLAGVAVYLFFSRGDSGATQAQAAASDPGAVVIHETAPPPRGERVLRGKVTSKGAPVAGAAIRASDPNAASAFTHRPCSCQDHCGNELLQCWCIHAAQTLTEAAAKREGDEPLLALATSGSDGSFELKGLPDGPVTVWAEVPGQGAARPITIDGTANADLVLEPGADLHGYAAEDQRRLAGVKVSVLHRDHPRWFEAVTDAQGVFHLSHLPPGPYVVLASQEGKLPALEFAGAGSSGETILLLDAPRKVEVVVFNGGAPAHGANVVLSENHRHLEAVADAEGKVIFEGLKPNEIYRVEAEQGGLHATDSAHPTEPGPIELNLTRTGTISGTVSRDGLPVAKATVYSRQGMLRLEAKTDEAGHYQLSGLMPGFHSFGAWHEKVWVGKEKQLTIATGGQATADFELEKKPALTGVVVDASGAPVGKAFVYVRLGPMMSGVDLTADDGTFAVMAEGDVELTATGAGGSHTMRLHAPAEGVRLRLSGGPALTATVRDERGEPVEGAEVRLTPKDFKPPPPGMMFFTSTGEIATAVTGKDGVAVLDNLDDGELIAQAFCKPVGLGPTSKPVNLTIAGQPSSVELPVERGLTIEGFVETSQHAPLEGVKVTAGGKGRSGSAEAITRGDGRFTLAGLSPGSYSLAVSKEGYFSHRGYADAAAGAKDVRFELDPGKRYTGRVLSKGQPLTQYQLNNKPVNDPGGGYELIAEPARSVQVEVTAPGFIREWRSLEPLEGTDRLPDIELERGREIKVTVLDAETQLPLAGVHVMAEMQSAQTGSSGRATLTTIPNKEVSVRATPMDDVHGPKDAVVSETQSSVELRLPAAAKLTGKVIDANGAPVENERLTATEKDKQHSWGALSGRDGTFALNQLGPGHYTVKLDEEPDSTPPVEVDLEEGGHAQVVLKKQRLVSVHLTVKDPLNRRLIDAFVVPGDEPFPDDFDFSGFSGVATSLWRGHGRVTEGHYTLMVFMGPHGDQASGGFARPVDLRMPSAELEVTAPAQLTHRQP